MAPSSPGTLSRGSYLFVEGLEHVLSVYEAEQHHDFVHEPLQLLLSGLLVTRAELGVDVFSWEITEYKVG